MSIIDSTPFSTNAFSIRHRYQKAKVKMLEKQVEDFGEIRRQLTEQVNDLQRQLKVEKEDNKQLKKRSVNADTMTRESSSILICRVTLLEADSRRNIKRPESAIQPNSVEQLTQVCVRRTSTNSLH